MSLSNGVSNWKFAYRLNIRRSDEFIYLLKDRTIKQFSKNYILYQVLARRVGHERMQQ